LYFDWDLKTRYGFFEKTQLGRAGTKDFKERIHPTGFRRRTGSIDDTELAGILKNPVNSV
jgi:hypothetical protein